MAVMIRLWEPVNGSILTPYLYREIHICDTGRGAGGIITCCYTNDHFSVGTHKTGAYGPGTSR